MTNRIKILISVSLIASLSSAFAVEPVPSLKSSVSAISIKPKRLGSEVVALVNNAPDSALEKLNFIELYFLKNAVMANRGYAFADDRPWLKKFFERDATEGLPACKGNEEDWSKCHVTPVCAQGCLNFDLSQFNFPSVDKNFEFKMTPEMNSAMAKIRQVQLRKVKSLAPVMPLVLRIDTDFKSFAKKSFSEGANDSDYIFVLGRSPVTEWSGAMDGYSMNSSDPFEISLVRDIRGDRSLLSLIDQFKQDKYEFDLAELLGLYLGNLDLLRKVILARAGRSFEEPLKTELMQLGVRASAMSVGNLGVDAKAALSKLDLAIESLAKGQLNDLPASLKVKALEIDNQSLSYSGAM